MTRTTSLFQPLPWDSELFGFSMAQLLPQKLRSLTPGQLLIDMDAQRLHFLQLLCPCEDLESIHHAEDLGFRFIDIRCTFEKKLLTPPIMPTQRPDLMVGLAAATDVPSLHAISTGLYADTRYAADPGFPRERLPVLYNTWISNAIAGIFDHVCYVLWLKQQPLAFCTVRFLENQGATLGLFGVAKEYQRQSLGSYLLYHVLAKLWERGCTQITVVTQGKNYAAQRTYQNLGFKTRDFSVWYHLWS